MISTENAVPIKALDSLRGLFSFTVLIGHFSIFENNLEDEGMIRLRNNLMHSSVDGFFCMSGFILCYCYEKKFEICFEDGFLNFLRVFLRYWANRMARIYPLVFFTTAFHAIIRIYTFPGNYHLIFYEYFLIIIWSKEYYSLACRYGIWPLWSLCVEIILYILFPLFIFIIYKFRKFFNLYTLLGLLSIHPIGHSCFQYFIYSTKESLFDITSFGALLRGIQDFLIGIICFQIYNYKHQKSFYYDIAGFLCLLSYILGHYYSYICDFGQNIWRKYNDRIIKEVDESLVMKEAIGNFHSNECIRFYLE